MIEVEGLVKRYTAEGPAAVDGLDLSVQAGEVYALLGRNGSGKSTTVGVLATLLAPTAGRAAVAGFDVVERPADVRQRIGVTLQEAGVDPEATGRELLTLHGRLLGLGATDAAARASELLERFELVGAADRRARTYSGGMRRRLDLATALIGSPSVVFLDEPTTGLDPQARLLVWERLRALTAEGKTLLLTTHYMEEAARLCDRLVIMEGGLIIAQGSPRELVEEYVSPHVLEFRAPAGSLERLQPILEAASDAVERSGEALLAFTADGEALMREVRASGLEVDNTVYRQAGLEDVFLRLTGRRLIE